MLTIAAAARQLAVSERTLRREIADGRLPAVRVRSMYRIRPEDLAAYLARLPACRSEEKATDGKFACVSAVADALSAHYRQAPAVPTRGPSKIRSAARRSTLRLVADLPPS
jgi:excisionase family DNA binding protein